MSERHFRPPLDRSSGPVASKERQSEDARAQNLRTIRIRRIGNGYFLVPGDDPQGFAAMSREEMHREVDKFFDRIEN